MAYHFDRYAYNVNKLPAKLPSESEIRAQVKELVARGAVHWRHHAELAMAKRGWSRDQVKAGLVRGAFDERPHQPNRSGPVQYEFTVRALIDGEQIFIAASLIPADAVVVITIKNRRSRA